MTRFAPPVETSRHEMKKCRFVARLLLGLLIFEDTPAIR
jgi:hypothetical protein